MNFCAQRVDKPGRHHELGAESTADISTYRSVKLISSIGSSSEGFCTLRESTKPSSPCPSSPAPESAGTRFSNTSGPSSFPSSGAEVDNGSVLSLTGSDVACLAERVELESRLSILENDRDGCKCGLPEPLLETSDMSSVGAAPGPILRKALVVR